MRESEVGSQARSQRCRRVRHAQTSIRRGDATTLAGFRDAPDSEPSPPRRWSRPTSIPTVGNRSESSIRDHEARRPRFSLGSKLRQVKMFKKKDEKLQQLERIPLSKDFGADELRTISQHAELATYEPGSTLIEKSSLSSQFFIIVEGSVLGGEGWRHGCRPRGWHCGRGVRVARSVDTAARPPLGVFDGAANRHGHRRPGLARRDPGVRASRFRGIA